VTAARLHSLPLSRIGVWGMIPLMIGVISSSLFTLASCVGGLGLGWVGARGDGVALQKGGDDVNEFYLLCVKNV